MNTGKKTCDILKEIRKTIGEKENIDLNQKECNFKGNCSGTCPKCEKELDMINKKVNHKKLVSIFSTIGLASTLVACSPTNNDGEIIDTPETMEKEVNICKSNNDKITDSQILSGDISINEENQESSFDEEYVYSEDENETKDIKGINDLNISDDMKKMLTENMLNKNRLRGVINPRVGIRR